MTAGMEHEADKGISKHVRINSEVSYREAEPFFTWENTDSSSSSDSSSVELNFGEKDFLSCSYLESEQIGLAWHRGLSPPKVSPPVQVMGKSSGYDPNRIPAYVFSSKPATPTEWSVASNDSLFSIHMGNNSFSKDLPILLAKSQELGKLDELTNFPFSRLPPATEAADTERAPVHSRKASGGTEASTEASTSVFVTTLEDQKKQNVLPSMEGHKSVPPSQFYGLVGEGQINSTVKVEASSAKQKPQPQTPRANQNAAGCNWFSCFPCFSCVSCRPHCC